MRRLEEFFLWITDDDITPMATTLPTDGNTSSLMQENTYQGLIAGSHVKQIQNHVNANLSLLPYYIDMTILPISSTLIVLRSTWKEDIIPELVKQEDSERGVFGALPHVGLTSCVWPKRNLHLS